jgi:hypothetical protein
MDMSALTKPQLEKQNRDLRARLENRQGKSELALCAMEEEMARLKAQAINDANIIAMLQREVAALTQELLKARDLRVETMQERIDAKVTTAVEDATAPLLEELAKAHIEIARLKAIINKDSGNSSKPPSKDGFKTVPNNREKSDKPRGGQKGHPGHRLGLPEGLDALLETGAVIERVIDHTGGNSEYISRFVIDVEVVTTITEYRFAKDAPLPVGLYNEVSYGDTLKAISVILLSEGIIAEKRLSEILSGLTHGAVTISPATLEKFQLQFAQKLERNGELDVIKEDLLNGEVINVDDTPLRCYETIDYLDNGEQIIRVAEKTSFDATVRTHSNERSTLYTVNPRKDKAGVERDDILPNFFGILSHDHESKFYNYGTWHATCGEHLLRDLKGLRDLSCIPWAGDMRSLIAKMNKHKNNDLAEGSSACAPEVLAKFEKEYDDLMELGRDGLGRMQEGSFGYNDFKNMLVRLTDYKDCYLLFIRNYKAPFTNNLAERDLRGEKTRQNISGLFRSWKGINTHAKIRSFLSTVKKRKQDIFYAITRVAEGLPVLS